MYYYYLHLKIKFLLLSKSILNSPLKFFVAIDAHVHYQILKI
jgi:hypothetical protein